MTKFEAMDNMDTNFVALSDQELMEMEGGLAPLVIGVVAATIGTGLVVGATAGYYANRP